MNMFLENSNKSDIFDKFKNSIHSSRIVKLITKPKSSTDSFCINVGNRFDIFKFDYNGAPYHTHTIYLDDDNHICRLYYGYPRQYLFHFTGIYDYNDVYAQLENGNEVKIE